MGLLALLLCAFGGAAHAEETVLASVCRLIESAARAERLPVRYLTRLIWKESSFRSDVVSPAGAQGVAHAKRDFAALASARIPAAQRTELLALDRVNRLAPTGAPKSWYAAKDAPVEPPPLLLAAQSAKDEIRFVQIVRGGAN